MLILSYPTFKNKVCVGAMHPWGMTLWFISQPALTTSALAMFDTYGDEENKDRAEKGLLPLDRPRFKSQVLAQLGHNKVAVAVGEEGYDGLVYLYNEDGKLYLASGVMS
jgi:hypothetical protein